MLAIRLERRIVEHPVVLHLLNAHELPDMRFFSATFLSMIAIVTALVTRGCRTIEDPSAYVRAEVFSIPFWIEHATAEHPYMIPHRSNAEHVEIGRSDALDELRKRLRTARLIERDTYVDTRIMCALHRQDGSTDTVGFGMWGMSIKEHVYAMDTVALKIVAEYLSEEHQRIVESVALDRYRQGYQDW
jgi:hypothetical protein